jgi:hypothetical protein
MRKSVDSSSQGAARDSMPCGCCSGVFSSCCLFVGDSAEPRTEVQKMKSLLSNTFASFILFLFVFGANANFLPVNTAKTALVILFGLWLMKSVSAKRSGAFVAPCCLVSIIVPPGVLCLVSFAVAVGYSTYDFSVAYSYLIMLLEAIVGAILFYQVFFTGKSFNEFLRMLIGIYLAQSFIIILMLIIPAFRELIFALFGSDQIITLNERYGGFRGFGIAGSVTYDLAVALSIGMMFCTYLMAVEANNKILYIFIWLVLFIAVSMTGRTGYLGVLFSVFIIAFSWKRKQSLLAVWHTLYLVPLTVALSWLAVAVYAPSTALFIADTVLPYAFEMFLTFAETGELSTRSTDKTAAMYFPVDTRTFLWGDGFWDNPLGYGYYMNTDAGYMRHMLYYGAFVSLVLYAYYLMCFSMLVNRLRTYKLGRMLGVLLGLYFFIAHLKGDFLTGSAMNIKLVFLLLVYLLYSQRTRSVVVPKGQAVVPRACCSKRNLSDVSAC